MQNNWTVKEEEAGRLDVFLAKAGDFTRSRAEKEIRAGRVFVDEAVQAKPGHSLKTGQQVRLELVELQPYGLEKQNLPIDVLYQDDQLAVVCKPSGMVVHPAAGNSDGTLVNALLYHLDELSGIGGEARPGIVHRLDKDTSGLLLVAKTDFAHAALAQQLKDRSVERAYLAILLGTPKQDEGTVDAPIARHPVHRKKMAVVGGGKEAKTHWRILEHLDKACLIEARLDTGRTHQIRVHMASIGHPVLGDPLYAPKKSPEVAGGQLLHAYKVGFVHPATGRHMLFVKPPPDEFLTWLDKLRPPELRYREIGAVMQAHQKAFE